MLHHWLLPLVEAIGHDNTHVGCVMCQCRTAQKTSCPCNPFYYFISEKAFTVNSTWHFGTWVWGITASFLFPQQMMLMLKHPDGLASSAQGQKCCDTDSIWLEKWGEGGASQGKHSDQSEKQSLTTPCSGVCLEVRISVRIDNVPQDIVSGLSSFLFFFLLKLFLRIRDDQLMADVEKHCDWIHVSIKIQTKFCPSILSHSIFTTIPSLFQFFSLPLTQYLAMAISLSLPFSHLSTSHTHTHTIELMYVLQQPASWPLHSSFPLPQRRTQARPRLGCVNSRLWERKNSEAIQ